MDNLREAKQIRQMIVRLSRKLRGDLKKRLTKSAFGITPLHYNVLTALNNRAQTLQEIAREMEINPPTLVSAADILETKKFVTRTVDKKDRRKTPLKITKAGRTVLTKVPQVSNKDSFSSSLSRLNTKQRQQLIHYLEDLLN